MDGPPSALIQQTAIAQPTMPGSDYAKTTGAQPASTDTSVVRETGAAKPSTATQAVALPQSTHKASGDKGRSTTNDPAGGQSDARPLDPATSAVDQPTRTSTTRDVGGVIASIIVGGANQVTPQQSEQTGTSGPGTSAGGASGSSADDGVP